MQYKWISVALLLCASFSQANAANTFGVGAEYFDWRESDGSGTLVSEYGPRLALSLNMTQKQPNRYGFLWGYQGKLYGSRVIYDGATWGGTPVSSKSDYLGMANEGQVIFRHEYMDGDLDYIFGLGLDTWRRSIRNTALNINQLEDYQVYFVRIGFAYDQPNTPGFHGGAGVKGALKIKENAHLTSLGYTNNPSVRPGSRSSFYAELGYRFPSGRTDVVGYYDSYRFSQSDPVSVTDKSTGTTVQVVQPESKMDLWGVKFLFGF